MRKFVMVFLLAGGLLGGLAGVVRAQSPEELIVAGLAEQGYTVVLRDRTWLGRIWLVVENGEIRREIVFNPGTGEILRDYAVMLALVDESRTGRSTSRPTSVGAVVSNSDVVVQGDTAGAVGESGLAVGEPLVVYPSIGE